MPKSSRTAIIPVPVWMTESEYFSAGVPASRIPQIFSFHPLTANSGFALFSRDGALLYQSDALPDLSDAAEQFLSDTSHQKLNLNGSSYIYSSAELDWGLHLLFLTPYSDITEQLHAMMLRICSVHLSS